MYLYKHYVFTTIIFITVFTLSSCSMYLKKRVAERIFPTLDLNNDKSITYVEFRTVTSKDQEDIKYARKEALKKGVTVDEYMRSEFDRTDINKDGRIIFSEFLKSMDRD